MDTTRPWQGILLVSIAHFLAASSSQSETAGFKQSFKDFAARIPPAREQNDVFVFDAEKALTTIDIGLSSVDPRKDPAAIQGTYPTESPEIYERPYVREDPWVSAPPYFRSLYSPSRPREKDEITTDVVLEEKG
jgi:hypothetical protein